MGYSLSWVAVKGCPAEAVRATLGLIVSGKRMEFADAEIAGVMLPSGWYAVVSEHDRLELGSEKKLVPLSALGETIICWVEEHCNCTYAAAWRSGRRLWSVCHDGQAGLEHLQADGDLPAAFKGIRDKLGQELKTDGGDCLFSVPTDLAQAVTGYCHDEDVPGLATGAFEMLYATAASRELTDPKPWWTRLF